MSSLGAGKFGWPAVLFNLAGGLLVQKRRAEKALEASSMSYGIVRPGGMERPGVFASHCFMYITMCIKSYVIVLFVGGSEPGRDTFLFRLDSRLEQGR